MHASRRRHLGFTIIELMIVLAVVVVLTSLALPSFQSVVRKSRRAEAQAALLELALRQERWRADHPMYAQTPTQIGGTAPQVKLGRYYRFEIADATAFTFAVRAAVVSGAGQEHDRQGGIACTPLQIDQSGQRLPAACW